MGLLDGDRGDSRFFAIHVIVLPWLAFGLLALHFSITRRHGPAPPLGGAPADDPGVPFFPNHFLRSLLATVLTLAVLISLAALYPRPVGDPAAPFELPGELVSTWVVVDVTRALLHYVGPLGLTFVWLLGLSLALIPLLDRRPDRPLRQRPLALGLASAFFVTFLVAWLAGRQLQAPPAPELLMPGPEVVEPAERGAPLPEPGPEPIQPARPDTASLDGEPDR